MSEEVAVEATEAEPEISEQASAPETAEQTETPSDEQPAADKTFTQAELDEIVQKRINKLERKMERQRIEAEALVKARQEVQAKAEVSTPKPKVEDFSDYAEFQEALTDWKVDEKLRQIANQEATEKQRNTAEKSAQRANERQRELIESGERKYEDFEDVVKSDKNEYSQAAYLAILESDQSADIVYFLAKNQAEAKRIADLPAYAQAKEIGKLEDKLAAKKPMKPSNAPKPIDPIGSGSAHQKTIDAMSPDEYIAYRRKQGARWA